MDPRTEAPTTEAERSVRISTLAYEGDREAVQALLELGAQEALAQEGEIKVPTATYDLARKIFETFEPEVPEFEYGEEVAREGVPIGKVQNRYLDERGDWVYEVGQTPISANPYSASDLAPVGQGAAR